MQIGIIGGGAMGSLWASLLGLAGENHLWVVEKDAERYAAIGERGGIRFHDGTGAVKDVPARAVWQIEELPLYSLDGVILAVKAYQVDDVLAELLPVLRAHTPVLCLANGAGFGGESLAALWQRQGKAAELLPKLEQVFFAVSFQGAYLENPGEVYARGAGPIYWGSLPLMDAGSLPNVIARERLLDILSVIEGCCYRQDFPAAMWQKLLVNSVINPLTALWQVENGGLADGRLTEEQRRIKHNLLQEGLAVGAAYGKAVLGNPAFLSVDGVAQALAETIIATAENYSSMYQDVVHSRTTEIDFINGYLIHWGDRLGVPTPCHQEVYQQMEALFSA